MTKFFSGLALVAVLATQACSPCRAVITDTDVAQKAALFVTISKPAAPGEYHFGTCSAVATGPRTFYTAHHCLHGWDGEWIRVKPYGGTEREAVMVQCHLTDVAHKLRGTTSTEGMLEDMDGICEMTLTKGSKPFESWAPTCLGAWNEGETGIAIHGEEAHLSALCVGDKEKGLMWSECAGDDESIAPGSSGAGVVVNGCVAGVLILREHGSLVNTDRYLFSAIAP